MNLEARFLPCDGGPLDGDAVLVRPGQHPKPCLRVGVAVSAAELDGGKGASVRVVVAIAEDTVRNGQAVHEYRLCDLGHYHHEGAEVAR